KDDGKSTPAIITAIARIISNHSFFSIFVEMSNIYFSIPSFCIYYLLFPITQIILQLFLSIIWLHLDYKSFNNVNYYTNFNILVIFYTMKVPIIFPQKLLSL
ncbi:hypothetical protein D7X33_46490, partial [Butyricicoccus sp. 1XD8-22]